MDTWIEYGILKESGTNDQIHKEVFNFPGHKKMQIKTTLNFISPQLEGLPSRKKTTNVSKHVLNRNLYTLLVEMQISTTFMESRMEIS
jgi:hypothetical protein